MIRDGRMKVSIQEYLRQYFIKEHKLGQADAALLILDPEFGAAIEPYFLEAVEDMVEFELPIQNVPSHTEIAKMHDLCDEWIRKYDDRRRLHIQEYLKGINHPAADLLANDSPPLMGTPTYIKFLSFVFWGGIISLILWLI